MPGPMPHALAVNPATGFMESHGTSAFTFDTERKAQFLKVYRANGLRFRQTCKDIGLSHGTVHKHYQIDQAFREAMDECEREYAEHLEAVQRDIALTPRGFMDRCMQLRHLYPERYDRQNTSGGGSHITINITGDTLLGVMDRQKSLENQPITVAPEHTLEHSAPLPPSGVESLTVDSAAEGDERVPEGRT